VVVVMSVVDGTGSGRQKAAKSHELLSQLQLHTYSQPHSIQPASQQASKAKQSKPKLVPPLHRSSFVYCRRKEAAAESECRVSSRDCVLDLNKQQLLASSPFLACPAI